MHSLMKAMRWVLRLIVKFTYFVSKLYKEFVITKKPKPKTLNLNYKGTHLRRFGSSLLHPPPPQIDEQTVF